MSKLQLVSVVRSPLRDKKYRANWSDNTHTDFGASGYEDFTTHKDKERRRRYRARHINDDLSNPKSAGALSYYILWGESTNMSENIKTFKRKFSV